jgi:hypothetical protein
MKKNILIFAFFICLTAKHSNAQFRSVPSTISTPRGNVTVNTMVYMPGDFRNYAATSRKHKFKVVLKNDSDFTCRTTIDISDSVPFIKTRLQEDGKKVKIHPADTKELIRITDGEEWKAIVTDTSWLFKIGIGKINTYSIVAEEDTQIITAIQKGNDGPIVPLTSENLEPMIADNPDAMKFFKKKKLLKALRTYND